MVHHVLKHGVLRVPLVNALNELPRSVKVLDQSLPLHLQEANLASKTDIALAVATSENAMQVLIQSIRADVIAEIQGLLAELKPQGYIFKQDMPVTAADLQHDFNRDGPVSVSIFSPDYATQYEFFETIILNPNTVRVGFDDPTPFVAVVL